MLDTGAKPKHEPSPKQEWSIDIYKIPNSRTVAIVREPDFEGKDNVPEDWEFQVKISADSKTNVLREAESRYGCGGEWPQDVELSFYPLPDHRWRIFQTLDSDDPETLKLFGYSELWDSDQDPWQGDLPEREAIAELRGFSALEIRDKAKKIMEDLGVRSPSAWCYRGAS